MRCAHNSALPAVGLSSIFVAVLCIYDGQKTKKQTQKEYKAISVHAAAAATAASFPRQLPARAQRLLEKNNRGFTGTGDNPNSDRASSFD